jgi:hypothetical protein
VTMKSRSRIERSGNEKRRTKNDEFMAGSGTGARAFQKRYL